MLADYHVHTPYCGHAHGKVIQYIECAIDAGIDEIGFADHLGRYYLSRNQKRRYWDWGMDEKNIGRYFAEISGLKDIYREKISIKIGLEVDFIEGAEELLKPLIDDFKFDFILCSIHCMPRFNWEHISSFAHDTDTLPFYREYFRLARAALNSPYCDSLAHLDFIWRQIPLPWKAHDEIFQDIAETVHTAKHRDRCIEINANGYIWSRAAQYMDFHDPFICFLDQISQHNVPVTLGSDAHEPLMVGKVFGDIVSLLGGRNIRSACLFSDRAPQMVSLG